jgi:hypothetical protein
MRILMIFKMDLIKMKEREDLSRSHQFYLKEIKTTLVLIPNLHKIKSDQQCHTLVLSHKIPLNINQ